MHVQSHQVHRSEIQLRQIFDLYSEKNTHVVSSPNYCYFYSASALLAMQSAVLARGILSVCPSVRLSFRHVPVLCPDE